MKFELYRTPEGVLALVDGVARGMVTYFWLDPKTNTRYYTGENPSRKSDGMCVTGSWGSSECLGDFSPEDCKRTRKLLTVPNNFEMPSWDNGEEEENLRDDSIEFDREVKNKIKESVSVRRLIS